MNIYINWYGNLSLKYFNHLVLQANVEPNIYKILSPKVRQIQRETGAHAVPAIQEVTEIIIKQ